MKCKFFDRRPIVHEQHRNFQEQYTVHSVKKNTKYTTLLHKSAQNPKFSNKNNHLPTWRDFKLFFSIPLFTIIFRPKIIFLVTDSILRVKTTVVSQSYSVLKISLEKIWQSKNRSALPGSLADMRQDYHSFKLHIPKKKGKKRMFKRFKHL